MNALPAMTEANPTAAACPALHAGDPCAPCALQPAPQAGAAPAPAVRRIKRGGLLFRPGDSFRCFYLVRCGTFKTVISTHDGKEQVTGFQLAGELLGLDGLADGTHASAAVALEDSDVIEISDARGAAGSFAVGDALPGLLSREIVREHKLMLLLGAMDAQQRVASFLLNLARRYEARGYSGTGFHLRMTRAEIGSYLGLKLETVSRTLSLLQQRGLLQVCGRHVLGLDRAGLMRFFAVAQPAPDSAGQRAA
jgi:CRP/FNR family transcriptional regulator